MKRIFALLFFIFAAHTAQISAHALSSEERQTAIQKAMDKLHEKLDIYKKGLQKSQLPQKDQDMLYERERKRLTEWLPSDIGIQETALAAGKPNAGFTTRAVHHANKTSDWINRNITESHAMKGVLKMAAIGSAAALFAHHFGITYWLKHKIKQAFDRPSVYDVKNINKKSWFSSGDTDKKLLTDLVLSRKVRRPLEELIFLINKKQELEKAGSAKKKFYYPNVLLYGPPGTGKSRIAETIAHETGMNFISLPASRFTKIKNVGDQIAVIDEIFDKARRMGNTLIFLDEVESMVKDREEEGADENHVLITLMTNTSTPSDKFMLVAATNLRHKIEKALLSRIATQIEVPLPTAREIKLILDKKIQEYLLANGYTSSIDTSQWAHKLVGTSGRVLEQLVIAFGMRLDFYEKVDLNDAIVTEVLLERGVISVADAGQIGREYILEEGEELIPESAVSLDAASDDNDSVIATHEPLLP